MAVRDPLFVQNAGPTGILDVQECRVGLGALLTSFGSNRVNMKTGFRPGGSNPENAAFISASGSPDAFVHVASFQMFMNDTRSSNGGVYVITVDAQVDINVLSTPADPTNPRNDLIIVQVSDTFYGDGSSVAQVVQVVGTPAGSPVDPTPSGSPNWIPLARVRVNANATTITNANITDLRSSGHAKSMTNGKYSVAAGGILPVANQTERDNNTLPTGQIVYRMDTHALEIWDFNLGTWQSYDTTWQTYSPAWTSTGTAPVLGNGTITGKYFRWGKQCMVEAQVLMGSTTTFGTGTYSLSLPFTGASNGLNLVGGSYCRDSSAGSLGHFPGITVIGSAATTAAAATVGNAIAGSTVPFTWASGDTLAMTCTYETV